MGQVQWVAVVAGLGGGKRTRISKSRVLCLACLACLGSSCVSRLSCDVTAVVAVLLPAVTTDVARNVVCLCVCVCVLGGDIRGPTGVRPWASIFRAVHGRRHQAD